MNVKGNNNKKVSPNALAEKQSLRKMWIHWLWAWNFVTKDMVKDEMLNAFIVVFALIFTVKFCHLAFQLPKIARRVCGNVALLV